MMMILTEIENISSDFIHKLFFKDTIGDINTELMVVNMLNAQK